MYVYLLLIQGNLLHLYQFLDKQKKLKMSKKNILIFNNLETEFNNLYHGFFKKDLNALEEVNDQARSLLYKDTYKQLEKVTGKESITIYYFGEMARLIYLITSPMLGILLE
jgi:dolichol kinase